MHRRIINLCILYFILTISLYPLWFFLATHDNNTMLENPFTTSVEKDFNELNTDDKYQDWNYFDAYLDKYNPLISFDNKEVVLEEELIKNEYDYYYIDSFSDLDNYDNVLNYDQEEYSINYYGNLSHKFIFFDTTNEVTIYYHEKIINHSVILNNFLPSAKQVTIVYSKSLLIWNSIIPEIKLEKNTRNVNLYLINSLLNVETFSNEVNYKIINCPYIGISGNEDQYPKYIKYNYPILNSVI